MLVVCMNGLCNFVLWWMNVLSRIFSFEDCN
uniref:Uncharacterized protein n=1 Tax=Aegilops tauschii subsp. strangulata TaxID=200361 RepID=A0A453B1C0_AEGTS